MRQQSCMFNSQVERVEADGAGWVRGLLGVLGPAAEGPARTEPAGWFTYWRGTVCMSVLHAWGGKGRSMSELTGCRSQRLESLARADLSVRVPGLHGVVHPDAATAYDALRS